MNTDRLSICFAKEDNLVTREIAGETIVVPIRTKTADLDSIFALNEVRTLVWNLLNGRTSVSQIVDSISAAYDVSRDKATSDTIVFLHSLEAEELIHEKPKGWEME